MMNDDQNISDEEILPEYSLQGGIRGKYADQDARGTNLARPDLAIPPFCSEPDDDPLPSG
jgi:hypothetical protein